MKRRTRHRLDLLPLLDVFMVVLFVFSTIREGEVIEHAREPEARARALAVELARASAMLEQERDERERERTRQAEAMERILQRVDPASGRNAVRRHELLAKLLDHQAVFEIEVIGSWAAEDRVENHCCYRDDPLTDAWQSCGLVPNRSDAREAWWQDGGGGLVSALRRTRGGKALVVLRQDARAKHRVSRELEALVRAKFGDHIVYDDGVDPVSTRCLESG